jgi:hypothetical protein
VLFCWAKILLAIELINGTVADNKVITAIPVTYFAILLMTIWLRMDFMI